MDGKTRKKKVIYAVLDNDSSLMEGVAQYAQEAGWAVDFSMALRYGEGLDHWDADGVIVLFGSFIQLFYPFREKFAERILTTEAPMVSLDAYSARPPELPPDLPAVDYDTEAVARMAARHFIERGYRHLAFPTPGIFCPIRRELQFAAFSSEAAEHGARVYDCSIADFAKEISLIEKPLGVWCGVDRTTLELLEVCTAAGYHVPDDIALLGEGNVRILCDFAPIPLSSIDRAPERKTYEACRLLDQLMQGESLSESRVLIPPKGVVVRQSTDLLAVTNPHVAKAIQYIRKNFRKPIQVEDVIRQVPLSRRAVQDMFTESIGVTIAGEIRQHRIREAQRLLQESDLSVNAIASECGFAERGKLNRTFMKAFGMTAREWRLKHPWPFSDAEVN